MRWLVVHPGAGWSVADVHNGWVEALRALGEDVAEYNLNHRIQFFTSARFETGETGEHGETVFRRACTDTPTALNMAAENIWAACYSWWPDVVLAVSAFFTPPHLLQVMRDRGHKVVLLHTESPYQDDEQLIRAQHANLNLVNDPVNIGRYRELGPAEYMPHAWRPQVHYPGPGRPELKSDFCFVGTGFDSRIRFFEQMAAHLGGVDVLLGGGWPGLRKDSPVRDWLLDESMATGDDLRDLFEMTLVDNDQTAEFYRAAKTGINFYRRESEDAHAGEGWAIGPREVEMAATGLWFARDPRGESDELFPMMPAYSGPEEAAQLVRWALAHDSEREKAAAKAREAVADRTFEANARRLLRLLDNQKG